MSTEAVAILRAALQGAQSRAGRSQVIDRLRAVRGRAHLGADDRLAEELVREDRELSRGRHDGDEPQAGYRASEAQGHRA